MGKSASNYGNSASNQKTRSNNSFKIDSNDKIGSNYSSNNQTKSQKSMKHSKSNGNVTKNKKLNASDLYKTNNTNNSKSYNSINSKESNSGSKNDMKSDMYAGIQEKFDKINAEINSFNIKMKGISTEKQKVLDFIKHKKSENNSSTNKLLNFNKSVSNSRNRIEPEKKQIEEYIEQPKVETEFAQRLKAKLQEFKLKTPKALLNK